MDKLFSYRGALWRRLVLAALGGLTQFNQAWGLDFMRDTPYDDRPFLTLNVIDEGNREALRIECGTSIFSKACKRAMDHLI
jgi:putative transposase